jgi:tRNA(adenine34) deaminase
VSDTLIINPFDDEHFMRDALRQARKAAKQDEVPIGAVIVYQGNVIGRAWNQVETLKDATAHAEMLALTQAESALGDWRLNECDLYVTKEPCPMCAGAIIHCRVRRVIFGCPDVKGGAAGGFWNLLQAPNLNHRTEITPGVLNDDCVRILKEFFAEARRRRTEGLEHKKGAAKGGDDVVVFDGP